MHSVYLDNNATTPLLPAVWEAMRPLALTHFGNPASAHSFGRRARQALEDARERLAALLGAHPDEVVFTSGGTEANNLAILGLAGTPAAHILTSPIEHPSAAEPVLQLARLGFTVEALPVNDRGIVPADALAGRLRPDTRLVGVMLVNHETGAIQPVAQLASARSGCAFHCDAVQAAGKLPIDFHDLGVTTLAISAHKFHGPRGIGALLVGRGARVQPLLHGGHQQQGRRPGTEAVALAVGMATALELAQDERQARTERVLRLRTRFLDALRATSAPLRRNGPEPASGHGLPHTLNLSFPGCRADALLMNLDLAGVACSTGSACSSGSLLPSPVLQAMEVGAEALHSALRFSFSALLSDDEVDEAARRVAAVVARLRDNK